MFYNYVKSDEGDGKMEDWIEKRKMEILKKINRTTTSP